MRRCNAHFLLPTLHNLSIHSHSHHNRHIRHIRLSRRILLKRERRSHRYRRSNPSSRRVTTSLCRIWGHRWATGRAWSTNISTRRSLRSLCRNCARPGCSNCAKNACAASSSASGATSGVCSRIACAHHPTEAQSLLRRKCLGKRTILVIPIIPAILAMRHINHPQQGRTGHICRLKCRPRSRSRPSRCRPACGARQTFRRRCNTVPVRCRCATEMG